MTRKYNSPIIIFKCLGKLMTKWCGETFYSLYTSKQRRQQWKERSTFKYCFTCLLRVSASWWVEGCLLLGSFLGLLQSKFIISSWETPGFPYRVGLFWGIDTLLRSTKTGFSTGSWVLRGRLYHGWLTWPQFGTDYLIFQNLFIF